VMVKKMVIVGTGLMGTGIAQVSVEAGIQVTVVGRTEDKCQTAKSTIRKGVEKSARRKASQLGLQGAKGEAEYVDSVLNNLEFATNVLESGVEEADVVLEAVVENLKVKQKLFADLEDRVPDHCLLVTNTSSFLLEDVCAKLIRKQGNFGGLHFFNPVPAMKLVEVVRGPETSQEAYEALYRLCQRIGKTPVKCKDSHGFIVNRLLVPYLADSMRLAEEGTASMQDIDTAMRLGTGYPMGPFELMDYIGLDTMKFIIDGWHQRMPNDQRFVPCGELDKLVAGGKLGRKSGEGFHRYNNGGK